MPEFRAWDMDNETHEQCKSNIQYCRCNQKLAKQAHGRFCLKNS